MKVKSLVALFTLCILASCEPAQPEQPFFNKPLTGQGERALLGAPKYEGMGSEPDWKVEIMPDNQVYFATPEGKASFSCAEPKIEEGSRIYTLDSRAIKFKMTISTGEKCSNPVPGFNSADQVEIVLNGKAYSGCGHTINL